MTTETPFYTLNTTNKIPGIGFGTWNSTEQEAYDAVIAALKAGYRLIDTAYIYRNEEIIGKAIKDSGVPRNEIFITTKLWATGASYPEKALEGSLERLGLDYIDLYLIHWPIAFNPDGNDPLLPTREDGSRDIIDRSYIDTYKDVVKLLETGKTKAIGVSNFTIAKLEKLAEVSDVVPSVLQVELHPYLAQQDLVDYAHSKGIVVEAYSPFGSTGAPLLKEELLKEIADKYDVSVSTLLISWAIWRDVIPLPKSSNVDRIAENLKFIKLSDEDGKAISELYKTTGLHRYVDPQWEGVKNFED